MGVIPLGSVRNLDPGSISGPETVDVYGVSFDLITIGNGGVGLYDVYVTDKDIIYRLK